MSFKLPTIKRKDQHVSCLAKDFPSFCWNNAADRLSSSSISDKQTKDYVLILPHEKENNGPQKDEKTLAIMRIGLLKGPEIGMTINLVLVFWVLVFQVLVLVFRTAI